MPDLVRHHFECRRGRKPWQLPPISYSVAAGAAAGLPPVAAPAWASGEDRSTFQPVSSWGSNDFAFMKATEGTSFIDPTFAANWASAKAGGKVRGAYHFFHPGLSAIDQARFFHSVVSAHGLEPGDSVVGDIEITTGADGSWVVSPRAASRMNVPISYAAPLHAGVVGSAAGIFMNEVAALAGPHSPAIVYTDLSVATQLGSCTAHGLWIAFPASSPPANVRPWADWLFWQNEFGGGQGGGDRDKFHGTRNDLLLWRSRQAGPPPSPRPGPGHTYITGDDMFQVPNGGTAISPLIPAAVPQADGTMAAPTVVRFGTTMARTIEFMLDDGGTWVQEPIDYAREPNAFELAGARSIKIRVASTDNLTGVITGDFA